LNSRIFRRCAHRLAVFDGRFGSGADLLRAFVALTGCLVMCGSAWGIDGAEVIRRLQARFEDMGSLSARFERRHFWKLVDQTQEIKGRLYVQRPDRFRFETKIQTVVTDGVTVWNYDSANEQVVISRYESSKDDQSQEKLLFDLILLGDYSDRYAPHYAGEARVDRKSCHLVALDARQDETYISQIRLWVDRDRWLVRQVEYRNINDDVTTYALSDLKTGKKLKATRFRFDPPDGIEVVDLR